MYKARYPDLYKSPVQEDSNRSRRSLIEKEPKDEAQEVDNEEDSSFFSLLEKRVADLDALRDSKTPLGTMRFGKRSPNPLGPMRFGKRAPALGPMRFGKRAPTLGPMRFGKRVKALGPMRFGKRAAAPQFGTMRFGKRTYDDSKIFL